MHDLIIMEVGYSFTYVPEIIFDVRFWKYLGSQFIEEGTPVSILKNHVGCLFLSFDVVPEELDDVGVIKLIMKYNLILR